MAIMETLQVQILPQVSESAARFAAVLLEIFLQEHPDHDLRVLDTPDGPSFRVVKKDEPCVSG